MDYLKVHLVISINPSRSYNHLLVFDFVITVININQMLGTGTKFFSHQQNVKACWRSQIRGFCCFQQPVNQAILSVWKTCWISELEQECQQERSRERVSRVISFVRSEKKRTNTSVKYINGDKCWVCGWCLLEWQPLANVLFLVIPHLWNEIRHYLQGCFQM